MSELIRDGMNHDDLMIQTAEAMAAWHKDKKTKIESVHMVNNVEGQWQPVNPEWLKDRYYRIAKESNKWLKTMWVKDKYNEIYFRIDGFWKNSDGATKYIIDTKWLTDGQLELGYIPCDPPS